MAIVGLLILGFVAGLIARAVVPGKDDMNIIATIVLGVLGSFAGGALWAAVSDESEITEFNTGGIILSIVGAVLLLVIYNRFVKSRVGRS